MNSVNADYLPGRVTNLDYLIDLSNGDAGFIREMVKIFLAEIPFEMQVLELSISQRDFRMVKHVAHKLRSTLPFVGLDQVMKNDITELEELAASHTDGERILNVFGRIRSTCIRATEELKE